MNKKGLVLNEVLWFIKIVLFMVLIGLIIFPVLVISGVDLSGATASGWSWITDTDGGTFGSASGIDIDRPIGAPTNITQELIDLCIINYTHAERMDNRCYYIAEVCSDSSITEWEKFWGGCYNT